MEDEMKIYEQMWYEQEQTTQQIENGIEPQSNYVAEISKRLTWLMILCGAVVGYVVYLKLP